MNQSVERIVIVTGASRGLGEALALELAAPDALVLNLARGSSDALANAKGPVEQIACDLSQVALLPQVLDRALEPLPVSSAALLVLINNAAMLEPVGLAGALDAAEIFQHINVNLTAAMVLTDAFLRLTANAQGSRRIVNISSGAGRRPLAGESAYCAAKAGLDHFTRVVAVEQRAQPNGARIVSLAPGVIDTQMQTVIRSMPVERLPDVARFVEMKNSGALVSPQATAQRLVRFLLSDPFGANEIADLRDLPQ